MTGHREAIDRPDWLEGKTIAMVFKPFDPLQLIQNIAQLVQLTQLRRGAPRR